MSDDTASILNRILSTEKFDLLCQLWQVTAKKLNSQVVFLTQEDLSNYLVNPKEKISLLISQPLTALLLGKPQDDNLSYQVTISFETEAIARLLNQQINQYLTTLDIPHFTNFVNPCHQFFFKLLEIITAETVVYPRFASDSLAKEALDNQIEQERIINQVTNQINQNLDLLLIVKMTIDQVQKLLEVDRIVIYQLEVEIKKETGKKEIVDIVTYEARADENIPSIVNFHDETCFLGIPECRDKYRQGFTLAVDDITTNNNISPCLKMLMQQLQIRAKLVVPINVQGKLWGFIIAHQCYKPRRWKEYNIKFVRLVAQYLAIAIYQSESYQQLQEQKNLLELQVSQRAEELREALLVAQAANQLKSEFLDNMSHELRTPLTCVIGLSSTLLRWSGEKSLPPEKQKQYLQTIQESGKTLLTLINEVIEFSQIKAGKAMLNIRQASLSSLAKLVIHNLSEKARQNQVKLKLKLQVERQKDSVWLDVERVKQILYHLVDNAIKFTPAGGHVILRVWLENQQIVFQVEDTGIGISENQIPLLFEKFQQLEPSRQRTKGGAGLGLALTKQLIELHGGTIEVESIPEKGSLFTVCLPNQTGENKEKVTYNYKRLEQIKEGIAGIIVLLEKDEEIATIICELLMAANYQVIWLIHSSLAIKQIELLEPDVLIIEQQLPEVYDLSENLKKLQTINPIKILLLSEEMTANDWEYMSKKVIDDYIMKPIEPNKLLEKIENIMNNYE